VKAWTLVLTAALGCAPTAGGIHARMGYSEEGGLRVVDVPPGPAAEAGLRPDDRIVRIDDEPVRALSMQEIVERLRGRAGTKVSLEVLRDGEFLRLEVERTPYER